MKPVLGRNLRDRKVVSNSGVEIGRVLDATFENSGRLLSIIVAPEKQSKDFEDYVSSDNTISIPFDSVRAVGRYVIVEFPPAR